MAITNVNIGGVILDNVQYRDELLTLAGADSIAAGTILARSSVTAKLVLFAVGGANGSGTPIAILTYPVVVTGAGDVSVRAAVSGNFRKEKLIIDADGTGVNVTNVVLDQLRSFGMVAVDVKELNILDNQ